MITSPSHPLRTRMLLRGAAVMLAALSITAPAFAELDAYMRIKAVKQGEIRGSVTQKGREQSIAVNAVDHTLSMPIDALSGMATGKRSQKPITITKELDRSSVPLRMAFTSNEVLSQVTLQFFAPRPTPAAAGTGVETMYLTITLKNARIVSIHHVMPNNNDANLAKLAAYEEISLVYEEISWTWTDGNLTTSDSWGGSGKN